MPPINWDRWCWLTPTLQYIWLAPTLDIYLTLPNSVLYWTHPNTNNAYICIYLTHTDSRGYLTSPNKCIYLTLPNTFLNTKCTEYFVGASSCHCIWLSPTLFIIDTPVIASYHRKDKVFCRCWFVSLYLTLPNTFYSKYEKAQTLDRVFCRC